MLKLKKLPGGRSPFWYVRGKIKGQLVFESTGTPDRAQAEAYRRKREAEVYDYIALGKKRPTTFADAVDGYLNSGGDGRFLLPLLEHFAETPVADIRQAQVDAAAAKLYPDAKASTINRQCISKIITVIKYAADAEMPGAILRKIKRRREDKPVVNPASDEHIETLAPHLPDGVRALISMMTFTGLRTGEALRVREADIRDGFIHIRKTKNDEPRMVPVPEGWEWPPGGWGYSTTQGVGKALQRAHKAAGLPYRDGHELGRHAFAARWLRAGKGMKGLQLAGNWKKFSVPADIYGHLEITDIHSQMRELSKGVNIVVNNRPEYRPNSDQDVDFAQKKGPLVNTARPKSREETPRKGYETSLSREAGYGSAKRVNQGAHGQNFAQPVKICAAPAEALCRTP